MLCGFTAAPVRSQEAHFSVDSANSRPGDPRRLSSLTASAIGHESPGLPR
jgi:hypothetical protein